MITLYAKLENSENIHFRNVENNRLVLAKHMDGDEAILLRPTGQPMFVAFDVADSEVYFLIAPLVEQEWSFIRYLKDNESIELFGE